MSAILLALSVIILFAKMLLVAILLAFSLVILFGNLLPILLIISLLILLAKTLAICGSHLVDYIVS